MTPAPDLSILIVNWNSKGFLRKCLDSIYRETHGLDFEVIVVDNASFDGAAEMVADEFPQVRFIQSETNLGFARANNLAFEHSLGRVVFLLNPDTEIVGDAIHRMYDALSRTRDAGILGCKLLNSDLSVQTPCIKRFPTILAEALSSEWLRLRFPGAKLWSLDPLFSESPDLVRVDAVCGACQMIPREVYQAVGGLNTQYFMYAEDIEVSAAALVKGWKTYYIGTATIVHHGGKSSHGQGRGERWISTMQREAHWQFYRRWRGTAYAVLYRVTIGLVSLMRSLAIAILSPMLLLLRGKDDVLRAWQRWTAGFLWSLGFEELTDKFRGLLPGHPSVPDLMRGNASSRSDAVSPARESSAPHRISEPLHQDGPASYVLMTAAYNEEAYIEKTIQSVLSQTRLPKRWVIVSDGSVDRTDEIILAYAEKHDFIRFLRVPRAPGRSFASKVVALQGGSRLLQDVPFDFIGNLDADISVDPSYFESLMEHFEIDPKLGIASGFVSDKKGEDYQSNTTNRVYSVAHGAQLVRRECYEAIGGYAVLKYGGEDWHAQVSAMMNGWAAKAFPELNMLHHRPTGDGDNVLPYKFREGRMDYSLGSDPLFEVFKCAQRIVERPFFTGGMARLAGFVWSSIRRDRRPVSSEFVAFLRKDQRERLRLLFRLTSASSGVRHTANRDGFQVGIYTLKRVVKLIISLCFFAVSWIGATLRRRLNTKTERGTLVVLCYHDVGSQQRQQFARQMDTLLRFAEPAPVDLQPPLRSGSRFVSVTFDDGLITFVKHALPELEARNIPGTLFVVTGKLGQESDWRHYPDMPYSDRPGCILTSTQLREIADRVVIGSHSVTHPMLTEISETDAKRELKESRTTLERTLGRDVTLFSFPYGDFDDNLIKWCSEAGYRRIYTTVPSMAPSEVATFVIGRVSTDPTDWPLEFRLKLLGAYRWLPFAFALKRRIRSLFNGAPKTKQYESQDSVV